jgi:hypothetical protein
LILSLQIEKVLKEREEAKKNWCDNCPYYEEAKERATANG